MKSFKILVILALALLFSAACFTPAAFRSDVDVDEFARIAAKKAVVLMDVRTPEEFAAGHIEGALNSDWNSQGFLDDVSRQLQGSRPKLAIYCRSGRRSAAAADALCAAGYRVYNLSGGIVAWQEAGRPVVSGE